MAVVHFILIHNIHCMGLLTTLKKKLYFFIKKIAKFFDEIFAFLRKNVSNFLHNESDNYC